MTVGFVQSFIYVLGRSGKQFETEWKKQRRETHITVQSESLMESEMVLHIRICTCMYVYIYIYENKV